MHVCMSEKCFSAVLAAGHLIDELNSIGESDKRDEAWIEPDRILELVRLLQEQVDTIYWEALAKSA